jgi:hypothetical protein
VAILSAMERCATYKPWYDKKTGETYLKPDESRCQHYYCYFIDEELGLCGARPHYTVRARSIKLAQRSSGIGRRSGGMRSCCSASSGVSAVDVLTVLAQTSDVSA